jgi:branched-chain amino acid transport system substrate-binding protein
MKYGKISTITIILILVLTLFILTSTFSAAQEVPRIGISYPKTGIYSSLGPLHFDGLMMAIEDHGPLLGKKPELFVRDNGTDVAKGVASARELITKERVHILIGAINTPVNNAMATVCDEYKVPFIYPSGGSIFMSGIGKEVHHPQGVIKPNPHPYMFYTWLNSSQYGFGTIDVAEKYGLKWYFIGSDYEFGRESIGMAQKYLKEKFGDTYKNVGESWPKQGEVDYTAAITKAIAAKPDVVCVVVPGRFVQFQKQAATMGLKDVTHIHWMYGEIVSAQASGEAAFGITANVDYVVDNPDWPLSNEFARRFHKKYNYWPGWPSSSTYNGVQTFLLAIEKAKSLDSRKIMKAIEGFENPKPITGKPFYVRACDHKSVQPIYIVEWVKSDEYAPGRWKIIAKSKNPELGLLPCEVKAGYDKMKY